MGESDGTNGPAYGEARRHYRPLAKLRWPVVVAIATPDDDPAVTTLAMTHGVSIGGAFIESDLTVDVGLPLRLWLRPPPPHPPGVPEVLRLSAQVRWHNRSAKKSLPMGFGVQFRAITSADELTLHAYFSASEKVL